MMAKPIVQWGGFILIALWLSLILGTGYDMDDVYNSQVTGTLILTDRSIWEFTWGEFLGWLKGAGRLMPLAFYSYPLFHFLDSRLLYKLLTVSVMLADVWLFADLLKRIARNRFFPALWLFIFVSFIQIRNWFDPFLGFAFHVPLVCFFLFASLNFYVRYLECQTSSPRRMLLWISGALYACSMLTYEVSYACIPLFILLAIAFQKGMRSVIRASLPHLLVWLVIVLTSILLKTKLNPYFTNTYPNAAFHPNIVKAYKAFLVQAHASLPWSYVSIQPKAAPFALDGIHWIWIALQVAGLFGCLHFNRDREKFLGGFLTLWGLVLCLGPALVMGFSGYQETLMNIGFGFGYVVVFMQYFGLSAAFAAIIITLHSRLNTKPLKAAFAILISLCFGWISLANLNQNLEVIRIRNSDHLYPRETLEAALKDGFFSLLGSQDTLVRMELFPHDNIWNYVKWEKRKLNIQEPSSFDPKSSSLGQGRAYALGYSYDDQRGTSGLVIMGEIANIVKDSAGKKVETLHVKSLRVYEYPTGRVKEFSIPAGRNFEFQGFLDRSIAIPRRLEDFKIESHLSS